MDTDDNMMIARGRGRLEELEDKWGYKRCWKET